MSLSDPVSDMLTRIRNANLIGSDVVTMPYSKVKDSILNVLKREGFIRDYTAEGGGAEKCLRVYLKYSSDRERTPVIRGLRRISKPGRRFYTEAKKTPRVRSGTGIAVISTSIGFLTDRDARAKNVGGEVVCYVW